MIRPLTLAALLLTGCGSCGDDPKDFVEPDGGADAGSDASIDPTALTISVTPTTLMIVEGGVSSTFSVSMSKAPDGEVAISWSSTRLLIEPSSVLFTPREFDPQIITVSAVDNEVLNDSSPEMLRATVVGAELAVDDVVVTIVDDDAPTIGVNPEALAMTEGESRSIGVVLGAEPNGDVTIPIVSDDPSIVVDPAELVFTASNPGVTRTVTVTSKADDISEEDVSASVRFGPATGGRYDGIEALATVLSRDDDVAGIIVDKGVLTTNARGGIDSLSVRLGSEPLAAVSVALSGDATEGVITPAVLDFDASNWSTPQAVSVQGTDDMLCGEGPVSYPLIASATSANETYDGLGAPNVTVTNHSDMTCSVSVSPLTVSIEEGESATLSLSAVGGVPGADALISLTASDSAVSLSANDVTLMPGIATQDVTISVADDSFCNADRQHLVEANLTPGSHGLTGALDDVTVVVVNDDVCGISANPAVGLTTYEAGGSDTFEVVLTAEPTADVVLSITSSDTTEGVVSPDSLTFTPANWDSPQLVSVTGVDDLCCDGNKLYQVELSASSTDANFDALSLLVFVTNADDDAGGFVVVPDPSGTPQRTNESGSSVSFDISLTTPIICDDPQAIGHVTIPILVTDPTEGVVSTSSIVFTATNWMTPQTVTVTGVDDNEQDGPVQYNVILDTTSSSEPAWNNIDPPNVPIINEDDD